MRYKAYSFSLFYFLFILLFTSACGSTSENNDKSVTGVDTTIVSRETTPSPPDFAGQEMEVRTFEVIDSTSKKSLGWGYDIYIGGKRTIHQPIIPAIPGNNSFSSAEKANKTGLFMMGKMQKTGSLTPISIAELDSLGVTK